MATDSVAGRKNPFVGALSLAVGDPIFGRDRELVELLQLLITRRIVLLHAPSGAGKTSLVQAGLIPQLAGEGFSVLPVARLQYRPADAAPQSAGSNRYIYSLLYSLASGDQQEPAPGEPAGSLAAALKRIQENGERHAPTALIIDQFEELFRDPFDIAEKEAFFIQLGEALHDSNLWALLVIRDDYVGSLMDGRYVRHLPTRLVNSFHLDLLSGEAAGQAIRNTALLGGREFAGPAVTKLVDNLRRVQQQDVAGALTEVYGPYVEPVQLQIVCRKLWQDLPPAQDAVSAADLEVLESRQPGLAGFDFVDRALADHYAQEVARIAPNCPVDEREIRYWIQNNLISKDGVRIPVLREPQATRGLNNQAIDALLATYLLRREERAGKIWYELTHDRLVRPVRLDNERWFDENLRLLQRRAELWSREKDNPESMLLLGETLAAEKAWADENAASLSEVDREFLAACLKKQAEEEEQVKEWAERLEMAGKLAGQEKKIRNLSIVVTLFTIVAACAAALLAMFIFANQRSSIRSIQHASTSGAAQANAEYSDVNSTRAAVNAAAESAKATLEAGAGEYADPAQATAAYVNAQSTLSAANWDVTFAAIEGTAAAAQATALASESGMSSEAATAGAATETARVETAAAEATDSALNTYATATAAYAAVIATASSNPLLALVRPREVVKVLESPGGYVTIQEIAGPARLLVLGQRRGWLQVLLPDGRTGWVDPTTVTFEGFPNQPGTEFQAP